MRSAANELRYILRKLVKKPGFALVSVLTLAVAIGASSAVFTVVNGVLLEPLPFEDADRLVGVWHVAPGLGVGPMSQSPALHFTYLDESRSFEEIGMYDAGRVSVTGIAEPEQVRAMWLTDRVLPMLRVQPLIGRAFTAEDDAPGTTETAMLSHGYWQERFGADPAVVGRTLRIEGRPVEIVGVMPADLHFLDYDPDIYLTFQFDRSEVFIGNFSYQAIARLHPGVTLEQAHADMARMIPLAVEKFPLPEGLTFEMIQEAGFAPLVVELKEDVVGDIGKVLWVLLGTVGLVLVIACANVTNLFLVRAESAQREVAVRSAMGAGRGRIAATCITESLVLAALGGIVGIGFAYAGVELLLRLSPASLPRLGEIAIDTQVLGFTVAVSIFSGLLFGTFAFLQSGRPELSTSLKEGGRGIGTGRQGVRNLLAVAQIALASVLLIGSGLMVRSFQALRNVHPGFERPEQVLSLRVSIPEAEIEDGSAVVRAHQNILGRLAALPGVDEVGATSSIPMDGWNSSDPLFVEEFLPAADELPPIRRFNWVTADYFSTMQIPLIAGRTLTWQDIHERRRVGLISENLAREYWSDPSDALGKRVRESPASPWREIVGVVGNVHADGVDQEATPIVYWPMAMDGMWGEGDTVRRSLVYAIRTARPHPESMLTEVRQVIWAENPNLPLANVRTVAEILDRSMARTAFTLVMLGLAAAAAVLLGAIGTYGVISYTVSQRTREIGVRMALGAQRIDVSRMVLRQGGLVAALGIAVGLGAAIGLTRLMSALLYGVGTADPLTFVGTALSVGLVTLIASVIPARRATAVDPVDALSR
jgi:predicted permease